MIEKGETMIDASTIKQILSKEYDANEFISIFLNSKLIELKDFWESSKTNFPNNIKDDEIKKQFERLNKLLCFVWIILFLLIYFMEDY